MPTDFDNASAFALGVDVRSIINAREMKVVTEFLAGAKDESDRHRAHALLIRNGPVFWRQHPDFNAGGPLEAVAGSWSPADVDDCGCGRLDRAASVIGGFGLMVA